MKKDKQFEWTEDCQKAFDTLKQRFTEEPVLLMPDHSQPFQLESNASKYLTGAVLTQTDSNGEQHPVAFLSKTFNDTERNYEIYDRELLGIVRALEEWRHYIQGSGFKTTVHTDHKNLAYFIQTSPMLEQKTGTMVSVPIQIQPGVDPPTWTQDADIRRTITTTRLHSSGKPRQQRRSLVT
jgi:RNase H-like domain found in reverse transcriptase